MAKTHDIQVRRAGAARGTFSGAGGACAARQMATYLAHTEMGEPLRSIACANGTSPSTVLRAVRRIEAQRGDPLVERLFEALEVPVKAEIKEAEPKADNVNEPPAEGDSEPVRVMARAVWSGRRGAISAACASQKPFCSLRPTPGKAAYSARRMATRGRSP